MFEKNPWAASNQQQVKLNAFCILICSPHCKYIKYMVNLITWYIYLNYILKNLCLQPNIDIVFACLTRLLQFIGLPQSHVFLQNKIASYLYIVATRHEI